MLIQNPPTEIVPGLWMLGATAYPLYLYRDGEEAALFEGGIGALAPRVCRQLNELGLDSGQIRQLIVTHAHPDHVMAVPLLRQLFPRLQVIASAVAAGTLGAEKAVAFFRQIDEALTGSLVQSGRVAEAERATVPGDRQISVDRTVREGDAVTVGKAAFTVLETPGHSECSVSFFQAQSRLLVISDATGYYMPEQQSWWPNYFSGYAAYLGSIRRLAGLDAEVVCLSHNGAVRGAEAVAEYFRGALAATEAYHQRIVAETRAGKTSRQLAEELGAEIFRHTQVLPVEFFQKNCALLVKQSLKQEGL